MSTYLDRSIELLGEEKISSFKDKTILIIGLGGVGGTALCALYRSGFKNFILVDHDVVDPSNLNRQIMYNTSDIGKAKVNVCKEKIEAFSSDINVETHQLFIDEESLKSFENKKIDFIVDAIDKIPSKISIINFALRRGIPFIVSLGMGNRLSPSDVIITSLNKTENDPLARNLRYKLRKDGADLKSIPVIFSKETPLVKLDHPSSMMMVPSTAGLLIASYIIKNI